MTKQHNTFFLWNGYQIDPKITQNILYSHSFKSQNTLLTLEQHTTFSFCQSHRWSILIQSFATVVSENIFALKLISISPFWIYYLWKITIWVNIRLLGKNQWLIGYQISLIVIARQPKYHRFYALVFTPDFLWPSWSLKDVLICDKNFYKALKSALRSAPPNSYFGMSPLQCTMCILSSMFSFQPNKLRHILKVASW